MEFAKSSTGKNSYHDTQMTCKESPDDIVIGLAGNPNVGKSTVFNELTGLNQHTGNWPGKTVTSARGFFKNNNKNYALVDIPGTYSLYSLSYDEEVARDFICFGDAKAICVVCDATCLERNLNLVLQIIEVKPKTIVCVNLIDEAEKKKIKVDIKKLQEELGVPVVATSARNGVGLKKLQQKIEDLTKNDGLKPYRIEYPPQIEQVIQKLTPIIEKNIETQLPYRWIALRLIENNKSMVEKIKEYVGLEFEKVDELQDAISEAKESLYEQDFDPITIFDVITENIFKKAEEICQKVVIKKDEKYNQRQLKIDKFLTNKVTGVPVMLALLSVIFYITIKGANVPSEIIAKGLFYIEDKLVEFFVGVNAPPWLYGSLVLGGYRVLAWVVSVMLPPMAIFFPIFTILEDLGYLPRVAFNLDNSFQKCHTCGKQALCMCLGFGCNAAGVTGARIISSPRERLIAIITNNFVPCNGRFPLLIVVITMFFVGNSQFGAVRSSLLLTFIIVLGVVMTFIVSRFLSSTVLRGVPSNFTLELPPYRTPQIGKVIVRSIFDRTLFVLGRAIVVSFPAGIFIWIIANVYVGDLSILNFVSQTLDPFAKMIGLDGIILMAFILGMPANEIVIPIMLMGYTLSGSLIDYESIGQLSIILQNNGWTIVTAICVIIFSLMHWPCTTALITIKKETQSLKWTLVSFITPTICGIVICFLVNTGAKFLGI